MKQFAVIGLGNFSYYLATQLYKKGYEVLAIDKRPDLVQEIKDSVNQAIVADGIDRKTLEAMGLEQMDAAVVCIGSVLSNSILATLNLKDIGVKRVLAKALSEAHGRIFYKIGASEVFFPEKDLALPLAERIHSPNLIDYLPFLEGYSIIELSPAKDFIGKSLKDLDLINRLDIQIIAVKEVIKDQLILIPTAKFFIKDSDILIMLGRNESLDKLKVKEK